MKNKNLVGDIIQVKKIKSKGGQVRPTTKNKNQQEIYWLSLWVNEENLIHGLKKKFQV